MFLTNSLNSISSLKLILNGATFINIPAQFFSLKLVLFKIGVPITKSSKFDTSAIYIEKIAIKKLYKEILFSLQYSFILLISSFLTEN